MADLLQEFMDDVRADRINDLWRKYGKWVIYVALSIVLVTAAMSYQNHRRHVAAMEQTALYLEATNQLSAGNAQAALETLERLSAIAGEKYQGIVMLKKAQVLQALGKTEEVQKQFTALAARAGIDGDLGRVMRKQSVSETETQKAVLPLTRAEWAAWALVETGENAKAAAAFLALSQNKDLPATMHDRVVMMAQYLQTLPAKAGHE